MRTLVSRFLDSEFVVDESPLDVSAQEASGTPGDSGGAATGQDETDFVTEFGDLLRRQEELRELADQLKETQSSGEEIEPFIRKALPFLDSFEHVLKLGREHAESEELENWLKSVEAVHQRIAKLLAQQGLEPIESLGKPVDLDLHEVVEVRYTTEAPEETVVEERKKGYFFRGRLLRCAGVVVAQSPPGSG